MLGKFDIYSKIYYMDVEKFVRHLCRLVLRHQMPVWNYFVNSFYSAPIHFPNLPPSYLPATSADPPFPPIPRSGGTTHPSTPF